MLALGACGSSKSTSTSDTTAPAPAAVTLADLQSGDTSCYAIFSTGSGEATMNADFDLCPGGAKDASALKGSLVTYRTEKANVIATSCQGDPECKDTEEVDLVVMSSHGCSGSACDRQSTRAAMVLKKGG